jgi:histone RNA hairpin-binding protein
MKRSNVYINNRDPSSDTKGGDRKRAKFQTEEEFPKLNQSDPVHARRIQQRRREVAKGKNTIGYDKYIKKVPKHKRRLRSMQHPSTPDHTRDIPNKRWQGLVKAWRKALHQYDPPDLMKAFDQAAAEDGKKTPAKKAPDTTSVQAKQLSQAVEQGLLVDVSPQQGSDTIEVSPATLVSQQSPMRQVDELDEWENARGEEDEFFLDEEDSDDDLI